MAPNELWFFEFCKSATLGFQLRRINKWYAIGEYNLTEMITESNSVACGISSVVAFEDLAKWCNYIATD